MLESGNKKPMLLSKLITKIIKFDLYYPFINIFL